MDTAIKALRDITLKSDNKPPIGFLPKLPIKNTQILPTGLPYVANIRDLKTKEDCIRNNRLNISMEGSAERPSYHYNDHQTNKSFDMDKGDGYSVINGINYPRRAGFTKNLFMINKDKTVFAGGRSGEKPANDEEEERILLKKLQETREKKEAILKLMMENEKRQKEKEAFQERITKLRNDSTKKIQVRWRIYRDHKACKKQLETKRAELLRKIAGRCESLLVQFNQRLVQEDARMTESVGVIQRNVRKFLAKKKFKMLWRRKVAGFIQQKLCKTLINSRLNAGFARLRDCGAPKVDNSTFFITVAGVPATMGFTMATQDSSEFEVRNSSCSLISKAKNIPPSPKSNTHACKRHIHSKQTDCSLNNTSITSLHGTLEHKGDHHQITKNRSSRFGKDGDGIHGKSINSIAESSKPEEDGVVRKSSKDRRIPPTVPPKTNQSLLGDSKNRLGSRDLADRRAFKNMK